MVRDVPVVFLTAGRLLLRHWPALLSLALAGAAVRFWALWAAVEVSDWFGPLGLALLIVAPLAYLLPVVAMLGICRRSLPSLEAADESVEIAPTEGRRLRLVDVAVSVLLPFLAVYESYGLLSEDIERFRNQAAADELFSGLAAGLAGRDTEFDFQDRLGVYPLQIALMIVVVAWVLRWSLGRLERRLKFVALAFVGALFEVYYTAQLGAQYVFIQPRAKAWLQDRVAVDWVLDGYAWVVDAVGPVAGAVRATVDFATGVVGSLDAIVVLPLAWLALGAVVLGFKVSDDEGRGDAQEAPSRVRNRVARSFLADLRERFGALINGVRLITTAGLAPMLLFCLFFLVVLRLPSLLTLLTRAVVGPQEWDTWRVVLAAETAVGFALSMVLVAPLLAAGVDWLVRTRTARRTGEASTTPAPV